MKKAPVGLFNFNQNRKSVYTFTLFIPSANFYHFGQFFEEKLTKKAQKSPPVAMSGAYYSPAP